jgi:predicted nucleic acid-binding Zn ribbon protein
MSRIGGVIFSGTGFYTTENRQHGEDTVQLKNIPNSTIVSNDKTKDI